jgi:hypothetical protein
MTKQYLLKRPFRHLLKGLMVTGLLMASFQVAKADSICFAVADNDRDGDEDVLVMMQKDGGTVEIGGGLTGTLYMEAITFYLDGKTLFAADGDTLGILNLETGLFEPRDNKFGTGTGEEGPIEFSDIDGLTFDVATYVLYGIHRREHTTPPQDDILFQIDPVTGLFKPGVFGGADYVVVRIDGHPQYHDVDDIASDPTDGKLYIVANTGDGVESVLATLDKTTGVATLVDVIQTSGGQSIDDIESLSFEPDGGLYGSTGNGGVNKADAEPPTKNQLYQINKETAIAAPQGKLMPPAAVDGKIQHDYEAVSCVDESVISPQGEDLECVMYALHDEGKNDTQVVKIDPFGGYGQVGVVSTLGPMYRGLDLEGMAIIPCGNGNRGKLYATSGFHAGKVKKDVVVEVAGEDGYLYRIDRQSGLVIPIGSTGYSEVSGLTYNPADGCLYGWARGKNRKNRYETDQNGNQISKVGIIRICPDSPGGCEITAQNGMVTTEMLARFRPSPEVEKGSDSDTPDIEGVASSNDGTKIYGSAGSDLWVFDIATGELTLKCPNMVPAEVEAIEMQPNGLLLLGTDGKKEVAMVSYDPETCQVVATRTFMNLIYDDIESIEWPALECQYRSYLYESSGDAEIQLIEYEAVPSEVEAALRLALDEAGLQDAAIENEDGELIVYHAGMTLTATPIETSQVRAIRAEKNNSEVTEAKLLKEGDTWKLEFQLSNGVMQSYGLLSVSPDEEGLVKSIEDLKRVKKAKVEKGEITVTLDDGQQLKAQLDTASTPASESVPLGQPLVQKETTELKCDGEDVNNDGVPDCKVTYDDGTKQNLLMKAE